MLLHSLILDCDAVFDTYSAFFEHEQYTSEISVAVILLLLI